MSDIRDVAKLAGVSVGTVSNVYNNPQIVSQDTIEKVRKAAEMLKYSPNRMARGLAQAKTNMIGIMVSNIFHLNYIRCVEAMTNYMKPRGYTPLLITTNMRLQEELEAAQYFLEYKVDGVIVNSTLAIRETSHLLRLVDNNIHVVGITRPSERFDTIMPDFANAVSQMLACLEKLGHRDIGIVSPPLYEKDGAETSRVSRLETIKTIFGERLLRWREDYYGKAEGTAFEDGRRFIRAWLAAGKALPTAWVILFDDLALGAMHELQSAGICIPQDISIIGYCDFKYSLYSNPTLSTITGHDDQMGALAAKMLIERIDNPSTPVRLEHIRNEFIPRESIGPAPR